MDAQPASRASLSASAYRDRLLRLCLVEVSKPEFPRRPSWLRDENRQTRGHRQHLRERITFRSQTPAGELRSGRSPINFRDAARAA